MKCVYLCVCGEASRSLFRCVHACNECPFQGLSFAVERVSRSGNTHLGCDNAFFGGGLSGPARHCLCKSPQQRVKVTQVPGEHSSVVTAPADTWKTIPTITALCSHSRWLCHLSSLILPLVRCAVHLISHRSLVSFLSFEPSLLCYLL